MQSFSLHIYSLKYVLYVNKYIFYLSLINKEKLELTFLIFLNYFIICYCIVYLN